MPQHSRALSPHARARPCPARIVPKCSHSAACWSSCVSPSCSRCRAWPQSAKVTFVLTNDIYLMGETHRAGRQAARRLRAVGRRGEGRTRQGRPRDFRARRRHAVAVADVGHRRRRAHHRADQHDPARHLRARQPRVRFRQGGVLQAHGRGQVPALRRQPARRRRQAAARLSRIAPSSSSAACGSG